MQINKSMELEPHHCSLFSLLKMNLPSLLSATHEILLRLALDEGGFSHEGEDNVVVVATAEAVEANFKELGKVEVVSKLATAIMTVVVVEEALGVDDDSGGKTTTSHSETGMRPLISNQTGRCLRRLILTVWLS